MKWIPAYAGMTKTYVIATAGMQKVLARDELRSSNPGAIIKNLSGTFIERRVANPAVEIAPHPFFAMDGIYAENAGAIGCRDDTQ